MLCSKGKRQGANIFLKKYAANKTLDTIVAQQQRNLDRYQVVSIVKKAAVEDDVCGSAYGRGMALTPIGSSRLECAAP